MQESNELETVEGLETSSFFDESTSHEEETTKLDEDTIIHCDSLVKIFKTEELEVMALQGLDLDVKRGELMAIIGKSGSGKSTLMNMIGGLERPSAGQIIVDGKNLAHISEREMVDYRKYIIGFVWQKSSRNLLNYLTCRENIEAAMNFTKVKASEKRRKAEELLEKVGLPHKKNSYPNQLSGGEQQRVAIAVALANNPKILLADEPTGAVDSKTSNMIQDLFRSLNRELGITVIIVTHDISLAAKVDRVVMISDGKISTEKIMKENVRRQMDALAKAGEGAFGADGSLGPRVTGGEESHEEFSVMDKANRVQLSKDVLAEAGIDSKKVKISVEDGKIVITKK